MLSVRARCYMFSAHVHPIKMTLTVQDMLDELCADSNFFCEEREKQRKIIQSHLNMFGSFMQKINHDLLHSFLSMKDNDVSDDQNELISNLVALIMSGSDKPFIVVLANQNQLKMCRTLLNFPNVSVNINETSTFNWTALHAAAHNNNKEFVLMLLNHGGNPSLRASEESIGSNLRPEDVTTCEHIVRLLRTYK